MSDHPLPDDFDPQAYLELHPDVRQARMDPAAHYLRHGRAEGRAYRLLPLAEVPAGFDPEAYLEANPDVRAAGTDALLHYRTSGWREHRPTQPMSRMLKPRLDVPYDSDGLKTTHNHDFMADERFQAAYRRGVAAAAGSDYGWHWRVHIGLWAAQSALRVPGDFVECGVNRGFLSSAIMQLVDWDRTGRIFYLLDTFRGLDERYVTEVERAAGVIDRNAKELASGFYTSGLEAVQRNFAPWQNKRIVVGTVPETLDQVTSEAIAFLHIDMNNAAPEVAAMETLWPRVSTGGIVVLDDYAYYGYQTQKDAMDEWAARRQVPIASLPTGQGLIVKA